jgi:predicted adenylyl cyclase CyaB
MEEIEVKILNINHSAIEDKLSRLHAEKIFEGEIETSFFDFKDGSIKRAKNLLRLRREGEKIVLTFKRVHGNQAAKIADEYEVEVSNLETTKKILGSLGLWAFETMQKHRTSYKLNGTRFDIDRYEGKYAFIPEFLEIESNNIELIHKYAGLLGYGASDCLPWSTPDLISHYSKKKGEKETTRD